MSPTAWVLFGGIGLLILIGVVVAELNHRAQEPAQGHRLMDWWGIPPEQWAILMVAALIGIIYAVTMVGR